MKFEIRCYEPADWTALLKLVEACYGEAAEPPEWWRWRHFSLNAAYPEIYLAVHEGEIIGMRPLAYSPYTLRGQPLAGALFSAVMVHPNFRRMGVFRSLVNVAVEAAWSHGADFVTTMPNDLSYLGYIKLSWQDPGDRTLLVRPLNLVSLARSKLRPGWLGALIAILPQSVLRVMSPRGFQSSLSVRKVEQFDTAADEMAERIAAAYDGLILRRDCDWLNWRYGANPLVYYECFEARSGEGDLRGIVVTAVEVRYGIRVGYIVDLIGETDETRRVLISAAVRQLEEEGAQVVITVMSDPDYIADLCRQGFYRVPKRLSPKRFHTVYLTHPDKAAHLAPMQRIAKWHQTLGDWDGI